MRLVVGLSNPGRRHRGTRHNLGWEAVDRAARRSGIAVDTEDGFARVGRGSAGGHTVLFAKPETYMNVSGAAVADLRRRHRVPPEQVLVVVDDLDLPLGVLRMREKGSHGGHNGLRSVVEALGTTGFPRLRIGIGRPPAGVNPVDFVLERPTADERILLDEAVERAAEGALLWVTDGIQAAMRHCNAKPDAATMPPGSSTQSIQRSHRADGG